MLQLKYKDSFISLASGQTTEANRSSPLFAADTALVEWSVPINVQQSETNHADIQALFFELSEKVKSTFDVEVWCNGGFRSNAQLIIDGANNDRNFSGRNFLTGYLYFNVSVFYSQIENELLSDMELGGVRTFDYTTDDPTDLSDGYWQHFQNTWNNAFDYVVAPLINDAVTDDALANTFSPGLQNGLDLASNLAPHQRITPFVRVKYVLEQIFTEKGWKLDTSGLNDTEWERLFLFSTHYFDTAHYTTFVLPTTPIPFTSISFSLKDFMPKDKTKANLLFELCKKYLWAPIFDADAKTCRLVALKEIGKGTRKDWTKYCGHMMPSDFTTGEKIFAFKNTFEGDDTIPGGPGDFTNKIMGFPLFSEQYLPANDPVYDNTVFYCFLENKYFEQVYNGTSSIGEWRVLDYGIYDVDPTGATDTFESKVSTLPMKRYTFGFARVTMLPYANQPQNGVSGIRTMIYHGIVNHVTGAGDHSDYTYPYLSSVVTPPDGIIRLKWSNVYKHIFGSNDYGIIEYWARHWMRLIASPEIVTANIYLPWHELMNLAWDDEILINNVPYIIKTIVEPMPYTGFIKVTMQRLTMFSEAVIEPPSEVVYYTHTDTIEESDKIYKARQYVTGPAGATVTLKVATYSGGFLPFVFKTDDVTGVLDDRVLDDEFDIVIDGGGTGTFVVLIDGTAVDTGGFASRIDIIATDTGTVASTTTDQYQHQYDKVIL